MNSEPEGAVSLTSEERDLIMSLLAARPPENDNAGEWTPSDVISEWSAEEYRKIWMRLDDKLRSGGTGQGSAGGLFRRSREILAELRALGVLRTDNPPAGDYAEWLAREATTGTLEPNSMKSYDVLGPVSDEYPRGERIQVKARSLSDPPKPGQRQLSVFRSWDFDSLIAVLFDDRFGVTRAARVPIAVAEEHGRHIEHDNGWRVVANDAFLDLGDDWTDRLNGVADQSS